jgi:hypothetical protein
VDRGRNWARPSCTSAWNVPTYVQPMGSDSSAQSATVERISPRKARLLLTQNGRNRNLRMARVRELSGAMKRGEWELNGETIKIAEGGMLLDGQHRLEAVLHSGVTIESVVVRGLPIVTQDTIDTGRRRRLSDVLTLEGYPDAIALAAALNVLHRYRNDQRIDYSRSTAPTAQQALALLAANEGLIESVRVARSVTGAIGGPIGVFAALHYEFGKIDRAATDEFFSRLQDGANLSRSDPALHLRNYVIRPRRDRTFAHHPFHVAALLIKAFNLRRAGCGIAVLSFNLAEGFPELKDSQDAA